jgi:hypothetical protein
VALYLAFEIFVFDRCQDKYGGFLRPDLCVVGDFPTNFPGESPAASGTNSWKVSF